VNVPKAKYNTLFGEVEIKAPIDKGAIPGEVTISDESAKSYVYRELGLSKKLTRNDLLISAIENPINWLLLRNASLAKLGDDATRVFQSTYAQSILYCKTGSNCKFDSKKYQIPIQAQFWILLEV